MKITNKGAGRNGMDQVTKMSVLQPVVTAQPPPLLRIDNSELYTIHEETMPLCIRRTYMRDQTQNAHTYIMEYSSTMEIEKEKCYIIDELWQRL